MGRNKSERINTTLHMKVIYSSWLTQDLQKSSQLMGNTKEAEDSRGTELRNVVGRNKGEKDLPSVICSSWVTRGLQESSQLRGNADEAQDSRGTELRNVVGVEIKRKDPRSVICEAFKKAASQLRGNTIEVEHLGRAT